MRFCVLALFPLAAACGSGDFGAVYEKGCALYDEGKYPEALALLRPIAGKGYGPARNIMGLAYTRGAGVPMSEDTAVGWFRAGAEQGDEACSFNLAGMYLQGGLSAKRDYQEAAKWYKHAIEKNNSAMAMHNFGVMNERGLGMPEARGKALALYIRSAEQCYGPALLELEKFSGKGFQGLSTAAGENGEAEREVFSRLPLLKDRCSRSKASREAEFQLGGGTR